MTDLNEFTVAELLTQAASRCRNQILSGSRNPDISHFPFGDYEKAEEHIQMGQMWFTRALAKTQGVFNPADLEKS